MRSCGWWPTGLRRWGSECCRFDRADHCRLDGLVTQFDLLEARQKLLEEERHAERVLTLRRLRPVRLNGSPLPAADARPGANGDRLEPGSGPPPGPR